MTQHSQLATYVATPGGYWSGCRLLAKSTRMGGGNLHFKQVTGYWARVQRVGQLALSNRLHENHC